jgi:hypothetical protein
MGAAKNLDIALKVAEEGAKVARKAKVKPTVKEAKRIAFPGIYDDPRIIAEKASGRVASESPAMKQLFGVTRDDLYEMSKGRKGNIEGKLPGAAENPKGSKAAEKVMTKKNEQRLLDALYESEKYPELVKGMDPWYTMDPLFKQMVQLMGEEKAVKEYKKFNTLLGMASPGSEVTTEIPRGTAAYFLQKEGRFPEFEEFAGMPAAKRREIDFPQDILNVPGHMYHKTAHSTPMAKFLETGELGMDSPKVPMYIEASGVPETGFQTDVPVGDAHWSRAVGLGDTRTSKNFGASVSTPEMSMLAPWWRKKIAGEVGIESVPAQARTWGLFSPQTGVTTPIGKPKLEMISDKIMETARRLNISPEEARDLVLMGKTYAGKAGGGSIKAASKLAKAAKKTVYELAHEKASKNAEKLLGLPPGNTAKDRAKAMGFDVDNPVYHGTTSDIKEINPSKYGSSTETSSGDAGFWSSDDPHTAASFADYAAYAKPTNKNPRLMHLSGEQVRAKHPNRRQNIIPMYINKKNMLSIDQGGTSWEDLMKNPKHEENFIDLLNKINNDSYSVGEIKNFNDVTDFKLPKTSTHYVSPKPSSYRSINAAFDPAEAESADILKAGGGSIKALEKAIRVGEEAAKETLKKAKDYKPTKGKISELKDYVRDTKGEYGAQRVERAADLVPNLEKQYDLKALKEAFDGDNAKSLMVIHPGDFEKYAKPLPGDYAKPVEAIKFEGGKQVKTIIQPERGYSIRTGVDENGVTTWDLIKMHPEDYFDYLGNIARDKGFDWLPFLQIGEESGGTFKIAGHEGRHRNRALNKLGDESTLIQLNPTNIREGLPRRSQEEYQQGLIELLGPKPKVRPEDTYEKETRRMIELPEFFAEGGSSKKPSFFPKDSKPHKQGFPIEYEEYYPRSTRPESELLEEFNKDELTAKDYLKAAPTIAKTVGKMLKEQAVEELPTYTEPRAIPDIALNALATGVGSVSDLAFLGSGVDRPPLGSERLMDMLADLGVTSGTKRPLAENLLTIASPKVLRTAEKGINKLAPIVERSFTPITTTVEAVAPDLAKFKPIDFQEYVTNRLISNQYGGVPTKIMGDRITSKLPAQGVYFNEAGQLETNPMMAIDIPNVKDISKATELRSDIASAGKALNQESMAGIRFLPLATNKVDDATAILVRPKDGKITNEDVIKLGNEFGNSMVVSHNPRLGGVVLAPFGEPGGELQIAKSKIKDLFGSDMDIRAGHSSLQKDRFYMPRSDYSKEGARKVPKATKELRQELKKFETLRYPRPSSPSRTNPLTGDISD